MKSRTPGACGFSCLHIVVPLRRNYGRQCLRHSLSFFPSVPISSQSVAHRVLERRSAARRVALNVRRSVVMGRFGRVVLPGFLVALFAFALPAFATNVTVNGTTNFSSLDGSVDDQDHLVNGTFTVNGDLIVNGSINCNDNTPGNSAACSMRFAVTGNVTMNAGSGLFAENRQGSGSGANITFNAGGSVVLHGPASTFAGAKIGTSATS